VSRRRFWLTAVSVNWGRGYGPGEFKRNVLNVMEHIDGHEHVVLFVQELDEEPDPANEHPQFRRMLEPGSRRIHWRTREPIVVSPGFRVVRRRKHLTMPSGRKIDPRLKGIGPDRFVVSGVIEHRETGIRLALANDHPHRNMPEHPKVQVARQVGQGVFADELARLRAFDDGTSGLWGADKNDRRVPQLVQGERVAIQKGLDHLRYWEHPNGARLELVAKGSLEGAIDPHDPIWARFIVSAR
jgi:hypothetical protein